MNTIKTLSKSIQYKSIELNNQDDYLNLDLITIEIYNALKKNKFFSAEQCLKYCTILDDVYLQILLDIKNNCVNFYDKELFLMFFTKKSMKRMMKDLKN